MDPLVILAAGRGERLQSDILKPLQLINNVPLIVHQVHRFARQGIREIYIVTGYQEAKLHAALSAYEYAYPVSVQFISNSNWEKGNGTSVYAAAVALDRPFYLTMTDHVFSDVFIHQFLHYSVDMSVLVTDILGDHNQFLDRDDVTKVYVDDSGLIQNIGKTLVTFNQIDTGLFYFTQEIGVALRQAFLMGDFSLSGGVLQLAAQKQMGTYGCQQAFWMDVDTQSDFDYALSLQDQEVFV